MSNYDTFKNCIEDCLKQIEDNRNAMKVYIRKSDNQWLCGKKHKIVKLNRCFKRVKDSYGKVYCDKSEDMECTSCNNSFKRSKGPFYSCMQSCNVYMCSKCVICHRGGCQLKL